MKKMIFISLLIIIYSKNIINEFPKEINFDKDNYEFELTFPEDGALFIKIISDVKDYLIFSLDVNVGKMDSYTKGVNSPGIGMVVPFKKNYTHRIRLGMKSSGENGTIWMNPSTNEIKVNLNQIYEWKYNFSLLWGDQFNQLDKARLIYSIDNAEKKTILEFKYNDKLETENNIFVPNPLKICHEEECKKNITIYEIKKGESYKIYINLYKEVKYYENIGKDYIYYFLPSFEFHFICEEEKFKPYYIIIFILLGILLIGGIVLSIILIYRKKNKEKIRQTSSGNIMLELEENVEEL